MALSWKRLQSNKVLASYFDISDNLYQKLSITNSTLLPRIKILQYLLKIFFIISLNLLPSDEHFRPLTGYYLHDLLTFSYPLKIPSTSPTNFSILYLPKDISISHNGNFSVTPFSLSKPSSCFSLHLKIFKNPQNITLTRRNSATSHSIIPFFRALHIFL